jgi:hypothetical protein
MIPKGYNKQYFLINYNTHSTSPRHHGDNVSCPKIETYPLPLPAKIRLERQGIAGPASSGLGILSPLVYKRIILFYFSF